MTMDKYSQDDATLRDNLINEEHSLMSKMSRYMSSQEKTAEEQGDMDRTNMRLLQVRARISELDNKPKA
jgi:hypothetical protein